MTENLPISNQNSKAILGLFETATCPGRFLIYNIHKILMETAFSKFTINCVLIGKAVFILLKFLSAADTVTFKIPFWLTFCKAAISHFISIII